MKKYVLVTGGQLENKGAQSMTFIVVSEMKKKYPECEVVLFSNIDVVRPEEEKKRYCFTIERFPGPKQLVKWRAGSRDSLRDRFEKYLENALCVIDISGYRLGSNWGAKRALAYCEMIHYAKRYGVPVFIMPQSFGPFDFKGISAPVIDAEIRRNLRNAKVIMAREQEGKELLERKYKLKNVIKTSDMVIQSPNADPRCVYFDPPAIRELDIRENSVALIPNSKNNEYGAEEKMTAFYRALIGKLTEKGRNVYLLYHSVMDRKLCSSVKEMFSDNGRVILVEEELSCFEYSKNVTKFDYIIASRYHSIVHAYKNKVPALVIGWAVKYRELTSDFGQGKYCVDIAHLDIEKILEQAGALDASYRKESEVIGEHLSVLEQKNVFDYIEPLIGSTHEN